MNVCGLFFFISVGVKDEEYEFVCQLVEENLIFEYVIIDIVYGYFNVVIEMIQYFKKYLLDSFVIVGNVGMLEVVRELENVGVDVIKVGIGLGKVCIMKIKIGFGIGGW